LKVVKKGGGENFNEKGKERERRVRKTEKGEKKREGAIMLKEGRHGRKGPLQPRKGEKGFTDSRGGTPFLRTKKKAPAKKGKKQRQVLSERKG